MRRVAQGQAAAAAATLQLRKKRRSMADVVNDQLSRRGGSGANDGDDFDGTDGVAEAYEWVEDGEAHEADDDSNREHRPGARKRNRDAAGASSLDGSSAGAAGRAKSQKVEAAKAAPLRRRGPLDPSLAEGKYAAAPVASVEALMDDIFGDLDMAGIDAEADEDVSGDDDNDDGVAVSGEDGDEAAEQSAGGPKRSRKAKDLTEEEYAAFLEKKRLRRRAAGIAPASALPVPSSGQDSAVLEQLESLRQARMQLVKASADTTDTPAAASAGAQRTKDAVRHYLHLYSQLLRLRVRLQPVVTKAVSMPQYYAKSLFTHPSAAATLVDEAETAAIGAAYKTVVTDLRAVLSELYAVAVASGAAPSPKARASTAPTFAQLQTFHTQHVRTRADTCLAYWGSKLVQANSAKLKTISQPLPQQIEAILANMPRLRAKVHRNRSHLPILAHPLHARAAGVTQTEAPVTAAHAPSPSSSSDTLADAAVRRAAALAEGDVDNEIFDDSDFLRELVRRGGAVSHRLDSQLTELQREVLPAKESARVGFHRITKGKEVSYEPRPRLVGFLVSSGFDGSDRNDVVLRSLFQ